MSTNETLTTRTITGFKWAYLSVAIQAVLQLVVLSALAHMLPPKAFGLVSMALILTNFAERVGQLGIGPAIVQKEHLADSQVTTAFLISILMGFLISVVIYFVSPAVAAFFREPELESVVSVLGTIFIIDGLAVIPESLLRRQLQFRFLLLAENLSYLLGNGLVGISLALSGYGAWSLVGGIMAGRLIKAAILLWMLPQRLVFRISKLESLELLNVGVGFSLGRLLNFAAIQGDNFVVGRVLGASQLGAYSRGYQLMTLPANYFGQVMERVLFPALAKKQSQPESLRRVFLYGIEAVAYVALPMSVFIYVGAQEIVYVLFGKQWGEVVPVLQVLSLGILFRTAYKNCDTLTKAMGAVYQHALRQGTYAAFVIVGSLLGSRWGLIGVAAAVSVAVTINYILMASLSLRLLGLGWKAFLRSHLPSVWVSLWLYVVLAPLFDFLRTEIAVPFVRLAIGGGVAAAVMLLASRFAPHTFRLDLIPWVLKNVKFDKLGRVGRFVKNVLAATARTPDDVGAK